MRDAPRIIAVVFLIFAASSTALSAPAPLPDLSTFPAGMGVNIHFTDPKPGELEQIYAAGFRWVRMDFAWGGIERKKGEYDFSAYDRLISALDAHHIKAYFILDYSNRNYDNDLSPSSDEGRTAFAKWAAASVHHFKGHGIIWEMYNEPNIGFWRPTPNVDDYAKLALTVGKALREAEPGEIYIGPATSTIDLPFLETCFKAGCLEYWSAVSVHPYRQKDPETVVDEYRALRRLIAKYAPKDRQIPIISGEWGYSSVWHDFDEDRQAKYLPREVLTNIANDVPLSIWYDWHEDGKDPKEGEHHFGIVRPDEVNKGGNLYEPKPAYLAAKQMASQLSGFQFSKRIWVDDLQEYLLLFDEDGKEQRLVSWSASVTGQDSKHSCPFNSDDMDILHVEAGEHVDRPAGSIIPATQDVCYAIPRHPNELLQIAAAWSRAPAMIQVEAPCWALVQTTARNTLSHPITIITDGKRTVLNPGESLPVEAETKLNRGDEAALIDCVLAVDGYPKVAQRTQAIVVNPVHAIIFPRYGNTQSVAIENSTGQAFQSTAYLSGGDPTPAQYLEFKSGEKQKIVKFTLADNRPKDGRAGLELVDFNTQLNLTIKPHRYIGLGGFEKKVAESWRLIPDGDAKVGSEQTISADVPADGPLAPEASCEKITYRFDVGWKFIRLAPSREADAAIEGKPRTLGLWLYGDGQGNVARMRFTDKSGQTFQPDAGRITWIGWRYVTFPLDGANTAHWGGKDDGNVQFPIRIDSLLLLDSHNRDATHGEIYLSTPTLVYDQ